MHDQINIVLNDVLLCAAHQNRTDTHNTDENVARHTKKIRGVKHGRGIVACDRTRMLIGSEIMLHVAYNDNNHHKHCPVKCCREKKVQILLLLPPFARAPKYTSKKVG